MTVVAGASGYLLANKQQNANNKFDCRIKDEHLCRFFAKGQEIEGVINSGYLAKSVTTDKAGRLSEIIWQSESPNRMRIMSFENSEVTLDMIAIGTTVYVKDQTDELWWKQENFNSRNMLEEEQSGIGEVVRQKQTEFQKMSEDTQYRFIEMDKCDGLNCFKYEVMDNNQNNNVYIYFDNKDYLLRKIQTTNDEGLVSRFIIDYQGIVINEPAPIKIADPEQNIFL